ncbi:MAG: ankyrin repeat domain-containing protein [Bacteroidota bacterium]
MIEQLFSPQVIQALGWTLVHTLWQGALFALMTGILLLALRKFSAQARYVVTVGMLAIFMLTVFFTFFQQYDKPSYLSQNVGVGEGEQAVANQDVVPLDQTGLVEPVLDQQEIVVSTSQSFQEKTIQYFDQHLPLIVTLWLMGVLVLQLRFLGQLAYVQRLKNYGAERFPTEWAARIQTLEEQLNIRKSVQYLSSFRIDSPMTTGWLRPAVLFPKTLLQELENSQVVAILAHELAHIKRNDFLVNLIQTMLCILFFYHPGVWWMSARIKDEREHCCDDLAIQLTQKPLGYAKTLIHLKEKEMKITQAAAVAFVGNKPQGFKQRITRLVSGYFRSATYGEGVITAFILILMMGTAVFASQYNASSLATNNPDTISEVNATPPEVTPPNVATPLDLQDVDAGREVDVDYDSDGISRAGFMPDDIEFDIPNTRAPLTDFELLMEAVNDGNLRLVKYFLEQGIDVNQTNDWGFTPLMLAANENHSEIARVLIEAGAEVNYVNDDGWTALIEAADEGAYATAKVLINAGADVNLKGASNARSAAAMAASEGHPQILQLLLDNGASWNGGLGSQTPLHLAAEEGQIAVLEMLVKEGADLNVKDEHGRTALMHAAEEGQHAEARFLIENGADLDAVDEEGRTALMYAAEEDQSTMVGMLLDAGARADLRDEEGRSAIDYAAEEGAGEVLSQLMNSSSAMKKEALRPETLIMAAGEGEMAIVSELVEAGADVNATDENGQTALAEAASEGEFRVVTYLLDNGAKVDPDRSAQAPSALFLAAGESSPRVVALLIDRGANIEYRHTFQSININEASQADHLMIYKAATPLFVAIEESDQKTVRVLLDKGAGPNVTIRKKMFDIDGKQSWRELRALNEQTAEEQNYLRYDLTDWTPLMEAAEAGDLVSINLLLEAGADPNRQNSDGKTALDVAQNMGHTAIVERLR